MAARDVAVFGPMIKRLVEVGKTVRSEEDFATLLDTITDATNELLGANAASLLLIEEGQNTLLFKSASGSKADVVKGVRLEMGEGVAGQVAMTGEACIVNDAASDRRHDAFLASLIDFKPKNILCVPLRNDATVVGVLEVLDKREGGFTDEDCEILTMLAAEVAPIVLQARSHSLVD